MADLSVCSDCGGVDGCLKTCKWSARENEALARIERDHRDLELLAKVRAHPGTVAALNTLRRGRADLALMADLIELLSPPSGGKGGA